MKDAPLDPAEAAQDLATEFGAMATMEAQERIIRANATGTPEEVEFWQAVSRYLQSSYMNRRSGF